MMKKTILCATVTATLSLFAIGFTESTYAEQKTNAQYYQFDDEGNLLRPMNYREWIFAGTGTTPKSVHPDVLFPDFQNIYIDPYSYQVWKETGAFPDGTIVVKEVIKLGKTDSPVGKGFWQGDYISLSAEIKSKSRFPDTHGNWNFFNWTNRAEEKLNDKASALGARCSGCHVENAPEGGVFYNHFAVLRDAKGFGKGAPENLNTRKGLQK
ncbi:cytochrome P460 family protein [Enterovibrio norvegicus]|uniref:cytochrome P460 family protein n=1 Tax=Enterovibrio norvegicus TaxID=188144 RepID=UPI00354D6C55